MPLNAVDSLFHETYKQLLAEGHLKESRTGVDILMLPSQVMRFDLSGGKLPWASTRGLRHKQSSEEMEWFISGSSFIKFLRDRKNGIWDDWFIKGTDKYDEPTLRDLTTQERILLAVWKGLGENTVQAIKGRIVSSGVNGFASLTVPLSANESVIFNGLADYCDLPAIDKWLDGHYIARSVCLWPATSDDNRLSLDERLEIAKDLGLIQGATPLDSDKYPMEMMLDLMGIRERRDVVMPVSVKKRLTRVSKNMSEVWTKICWAIDDHAGDGSPLLTDTVQIWRTDKFVKQVLTASQQESVVKVLDQYKIPAWPLLDADIGPGGYGPQWRHWQDTQIVNCEKGDKVFKSYIEQGYRCAGTLDLEERHDPDFMYGDYIFHRKVDQLQNVINMLKTNPDDRRMLVTAWNPGLVWRSALPPCHLYFQFMTTHRPGQDVYDDLYTALKWKDFSGNWFEDSEGEQLTEETFVNRFNNDLGFRSYTEDHLNWSHYHIPTRDLHCLLVMR